MGRILNFYSWTMLIFLAGVGTAYPVTVTFTVDPTQNNNSISSYIYGSNFTIPGVTNPLYRQGGNRLSAYNWETNWSNGGSDWYYENDTNMGNKAEGPAWAVTNFYNQNKAVGADSLATLPLVGYVSANGEPSVQVPAADFMTAPGLTDPNGNFFPTILAKPGAPASYSVPPATIGPVVYTDEMVNYVVQKIGSSTSGGIKFWDLDNEPGVWPGTHKEVHNYPVSYIEVLSKGITAATQTKAIDPGAQILGPVAYAWGDFMSLGGAPDQNASYATPYKNGWTPWLNYYLAMMNQASVSQGVRLLDYLDLHVYSEGTDAAGNRINNNDVSQDAATTRMQLPREMWDPTYTENNWISCCVPNYGPMTLIPRLQATINQYYPGTKISFSEYSYGGNADISGGIAEADFLGILGKYPNMMACLWAGGTEPYLTCAFNFYLNYDGSGSKFGTTSVLANSSNVPEATVYAAKNSAKPNLLNVIILNKDYSNNTTASVTFSNLSGAISSIRAFRFDSTSSVISPSTAPGFTANTLTDTLPFRSATLYELTLSQGSPTSTPTNSPSLTPSPSQTKTSTPSNTITPSFTVTATSTQSRTLTPTSTSSPTPNNSATNTMTFTPTPSRTNTLTSTPTVTPTMTSTLTGTATRTQTPTATRTLTSTATTTQTGTSTSTRTQTNTSTATWTFTRTSTQTSTLTATPMYTQTTTQTNTSTRTTTSTATPTPTTTETATQTSQFSPTNTLSPTNTMTVTTTFTPTHTGTHTSTPTMTLSPTITSTPTQTFTPSQTFTPTSTATLTSTPTLTSTHTSTNSPTVTNTPTVTSTRTDTPVFTYTPTQTFTSTATPTSTSTATPTSTPTPSNTASWTPSSTPANTNTKTITPTITQTQTYTPTWTGTPSPTFSPMPTSTNTPTASSTPSITPAPTAIVGHVGIYPNPVTGPTVQVLPPPYMGVANVRVEIFTLAFRKVQDTIFDSIPSGTAVTVNLTGRGGNPLANGIYYAVVTVHEQRSIGKLLILR